MPTAALVLPLKVPVRHDLVRPLSEWLDSDEQVATYQDTTADGSLSWIVPKPTFKSADCREEILRLAGIRNTLSDILQDSHKVALESRAMEDCNEYHATLLEFEKRGFPTTDEEDNGISLTWRGAFSKRAEETHYSFIYDRACTLWNVAALQSYLASTGDLSTKDGCKTAISLSQSGASIMATLRELVENGDYLTVDLSKSMLSFWEKLLLAQGQLCIYRMANLGDGTVRQHTTLAYLVQAAASIYNEALAAAKSPRLQSDTPKQSQDWAIHCKNQSLICQSRAIFHIAIEHRLQQEHGREIARLRQCVQTLKEAHGFAKQSEVQSQFQEIEGLVKMATDRLKHAEEDNRQIYLEEVPGDLPEIRAQTMVKRNLPLAPTMTVTKAPMFVFVG